MVEIGTVAFTFIASGVLAGIATTIAVALGGRSVDGRAELDRRTVRRFLAHHPLVHRVARLVPDRAGPALAESIAISAAVIVAAVASLGVILVMVRQEVGLVSWDLPIATWAAQNSTETGATWMRELSKFGGTQYVVVAAIVVTAVAGWRDRRWAVPIYVVITMIGQFLVSNSIKWSVERARPDLVNLTGFSGTSFPSGHAVAAATAWACVAFLLGRGRSTTRRALLSGAAVAIGVVVAGTRIALGVHWTTDVIAGLVTGWTWFAVCTLIFGAGRLRPAEPITIAADSARRG